MGAYANPLLVTPGALRLPHDPVSPGRIIILIDNECGSAGEDFVLPFKVSGRGQLIGTATTGSTGQPFLYNFANGMTFRVGTKRVFFPDGSPFEGVGVTPDVLVQSTMANLRANKDVVLDRAIEMAKSAPSSH